MPCLRVSPVRLYEILGLRNEAGAAELEAFAAWEKALAFYERREFLAAGELFNAISTHNQKDGAALCGYVPELHRLPATAGLGRGQ
jgi:hypothetical protein